MTEPKSSKLSILHEATTHEHGDRLMRRIFEATTWISLVRAPTFWPYDLQHGYLHIPQAYRHQANRNKKSLGLSFGHKSGVDILHKLVKESDVLVENYLPGALKKYGMDYETVSKINPSLIYASITGYGQTGPYSNRAGYDVMVEA